VVESPVVAGRVANIRCISEGRPLPKLKIVSLPPLNVTFKTVLNNHVSQRRVATIVTAIADRLWHEGKVSCNGSIAHLDIEETKETVLDCFCKYYCLFLILINA